MVVLGLCVAQACLGTLWFLVHLGGHGLLVCRLCGATCREFRNLWFRVEGPRGFKAWLVIVEIFIIGLRGLGSVSAFRLGIQIHKVFCKICVGLWASRVKLLVKGWRAWWAWVWLCVFVN